MRTTLTVVAVLAIAAVGLDIAANFSNTAANVENNVIDNVNSTSDSLAKDVKIAGAVATGAGLSWLLLVLFP